MSRAAYREIMADAEPQRAEPAPAESQTSADMSLEMAALGVLVLFAGVFVLAALRGIVH